MPAKSVDGFVASLFGSQDSSDCCVSFCLSQDEVDRPSKRQKLEDAPGGTDAVGVAQAGAHEAGADDDLVGERLPAHSWVLRPGSGFFRAQLERWTGDRAAGSKPVLRVLLGTEADLPHARSAVRFIYTGELSVSSAADLLGVRRLACYLGVEEAVEACDAALCPLAAGPFGPLAGVVEVCSCRHLLPERGSNAASAELIDALRGSCQAQLAEYSGVADTQFTAPGGAKVQLGELLVWVFPDAPSVLSDPAAKARALQLTAASLEALLTCDAFGTDNEASVLLLLAEWLALHPEAFSQYRHRLCHCIRLNQLSSAYLQGVLPLLTWFPLMVDEHRLLCQYWAASDSRERECILKLVEKTRGKWPPSWTSDAPRPAVRHDVARSYEWHISEGELGAALGAVERGQTMYKSATFGHGSSRPVANGFEFYPELELKPGSDVAGVFVVCGLPSALQCSGAAVGAVRPGALRLVVRQGACGSGDGGVVEGKAAFTHPFSGQQHWFPGRTLGKTAALPLLTALAGSAPRPLLSRWSPYLHEGRISGTLEWLGPQGAAQG
ncbi:hypothetical protein HYH03_017027 [Edaphochlamys debaryana]|uniref:BTB domain-containing protein n=1 Tax=Edaphochlamys debaryana TaxID=47281 RepID=A0A835XNG9_9CHLO|nr:hypothetical protein HYH03_017027 [Edaphochlamys debaryana]|eukprot:KAG2484145.1 hypothetical protein HYH03_017027 [Edaphochlamys debaryana]